MFCALHVIVAFGVLLVVCSLTRANAVRLRVQLRPSPIQIFRPSCRFLSVSKPRSPRQFSLPLELAAACMCSMLLSLSAAPALEKSPPSFSPSFIRLLALQCCKPKPPRVVSPAYVPQERERERVKCSAIHPFSSKIREFGSSLSHKISVNSQQ